MGIQDKVSVFYVSREMARRVRQREKIAARKADALKTAEEFAIGGMRNARAFTLGLVELWLLLGGLDLHDLKEPAEKLLHRLKAAGQIHFDHEHAKWHWVAPV